MFGQKFADALHRGLQMVYAVGVADAGIALAGGTERRAGDDGDLLFPQELLTELAAGQAADLNGRIDGNT